PMSTTARSWSRCLAAPAPIWCWIFSPDVPAMPEPVLKIGVIGLGRAFTLMLPTFLADPRVRLGAACDPRPGARAQFQADFGGPAYDSAEALAHDPEGQVVYVASPHQHLAAHTPLAAAHGRHVLVEKPMALSLDECD